MLVSKKINNFQIIPILLKLFLKLKNQFKSGSFFSSTKWSPIFCFFFSMVLFDNRFFLSSYEFSFSTRKSSSSENSYLFFGRMLFSISWQIFVILSWIFLSLASFSAEKISFYDLTALFSSSSFWSFFFFFCSLASAFSCSYFSSIAFYWARICSLLFGIFALPFLSLLISNSFFSLSSLSFCWSNSSFLFTQSYTKSYSMF